MDIDALLTRLDRVRKSGDDRWMACCPAHQDRSASLSIRRTPTAILIHCFAGCGGADILGAIGLDFDALYPPRDNRRGPVWRDHSPYDALRSLQRHAEFVFAAATKLRAGTPLSEADIGNLVTVIETINRSASACGIRP